MGGVLNHEGVKSTKKRREERNRFSLPFFVLFTPSWFKSPSLSLSIFPIGRGK